MASYCSSSAPPRRRAFHHRCCLSSSSPHSLCPLSILPLCPYLLSEPSNKILLCYIFSTQRRRIDPAPCILVLGHSQRRSAAGEKMHENAATPPMVRPSGPTPSLLFPLSLYCTAPFLHHFYCTAAMGGKGRISMVCSKVRRTFYRKFGIAEQAALSRTSGHDLRTL